MSVFLVGELEMINKSTFHINFLRYKIPAYIFSSMLFMAGIGGYVYYGGLHYSVDFTGGRQIRFVFSNQVGSENLKNILHKNGWEDASVREFTETDIAVRVQNSKQEGREDGKIEAGEATESTENTDNQSIDQKMKAALETGLPGVTVTITEANYVGPAAGAELRRNAILMTTLGLLIMLLYIAVRFWSFSYGVGALVALLHDPLAIVALLAVTQIEVSPNVIMAILAVMGYSINDTIVIFARIRQHFALAHSGDSPEKIVNDSLNQTLSRTILTSFATFLVVLAFFLFGGESLRNLSLAFMTGILIGTYSSIFIASPIMLALRRS